MQSDYAWPTLSFVALSLLSVAVDAWRHGRRKAGLPSAGMGWVPWPLITILALIAAAVGASHWLQG